MTLLQDPPRLKDIGDLTLREALREARNDLPTPAQVAALGSALELALRVPPSVPPPGLFAGGGGAAGASAVGAKLVAVALVVATSTGAVLVALRGDAPARPVAPVAVAAPAESVELPATDAPEIPTAPAATPSTERPAESDAPAATSPPAEETPSELALLADARAALGASPARTLRILDVHRRAYPRGALAQEREVTAVEALSALGMHVAVIARADRFLSTHPGSAHAARVRVLRERAFTSTGSAPEPSTP